MVEGGKKRVVCRSISDSDVEYHACVGETQSSEAKPTTSAARKEAGLTRSHSYHYALEDSVFSEEKGRKSMALFRDYQVTSSAEASDSDKSSRGASPRMGRSRKISAMGSLPALHTASYLQNTSLDDDTLAYSADADTLRDTFANPPSDRHYPPRAVQERQSLPSVSYDDGCKTWFWRRRNGSIARCKVGHREPTFRDWLRHVQKTFKKRGKARQSLIKARLRRRKMPRESVSGDSPAAKRVCTTCACVVPYTAHAAAIAGHLDCLKASVRKGSKKVSRNGDTIMHVAAKHGHAECLRWIMTKCTDLKVWNTNSKGNTVVHCAMDSGSIECVKAVLSGLTTSDTTLVTEAVNNMLYQANSAGMTPVLVAVSQKRTELFAFLLKTFGERLPGIVNNKVGGATAFHYAAAAGSVPILTQLYEYFPKLAGMSVPQTGKLPIHLAVNTGQVEAAKYLHSVTTNGLLVRSGDGLNCFNQAVQNGHLDCVKWMMQVYTEPEERVACLRQVDSERATLFHFAAAFGETKVMQYLLGQLPEDKSFATNARDIWDRTPLHDTTEKNHLNCMKLLLAAGADIFARDKDGNTPYSLAMQHEKLKTYIEQHMTSCKVPDEYQAAKSAVAEAGPKGDEDRVDAAPKLSRGANPRVSIRFKVKPPRPDILTEDTSTIAPPHVYVAVTVSTDHDDTEYSCTATPDNLSPVPADPQHPLLPAATASPKTLLAGDFTPPMVPRQRSSSWSVADDEPLSPGLLGTPKPRQDRSASVSDVFVMPSVPAFPCVDTEQPRVKIIYSCPSSDRMSNEVRKLSYSMEMLGVETAIVRVKKDTLSAQKVKSAATLVAWLQQEQENFTHVLLVCSVNLQELFEHVLSKGKPKKTKSNDKSDPAAPPVSDVVLPPELFSAIKPVVLLHGGSSRYCPAWLRPSACFYWPKNQPAMFRKLGFSLPIQTLSVPTSRKRANTM